MAQPSWIADAIFYQIFPERFANGDPRLNPPQVQPWNAAPTPDNFMGGDLKGIDEHLGYLVDLGINALYLNPIFEAKTNHRYDAVDYFKIDPYLGSDDDFDQLIKDAHQRGIRVILDGVFNHCGNGHTYFRDVMKNEADSKYVNWYFIENFPVNSDPTKFNYKTCTDCYYLPKWNAYNPEVKEHHFNVAKYWLERGIDGWRLDVPYFVNKNFWYEFNEVVKAYGEDKYLVAEDWQDPNPWLKGGLMDGVMNYTLRDLVLAFTADNSISAERFATGMNELTESMPESHRFGMLNLIGSHDTQRIFTHARENEAKVIQAFAALYASQGAPMLYYGDENGMPGENDPGCRAGMRWDQNDWNKPIRDAVTGLLAARVESDVLRRGDQKVRTVDAETVMIQRKYGDKGAVTLIHRGKGRNVKAEDIPLNNPRSLFGVPSMIGEAYRLDERHPLILEGDVRSDLW